jgi:hypothetical protein
MKDKSSEKLSNKCILRIGKMFLPNSDHEWQGVSSIKKPVVRKAGDKIT